MFIGGADATAWLLPGEDQHPWHQNSVGYRWRKTRDAVGVDALKLHDLRHFYDSGLIAAGCDVVTVQRAVGHSSPTVTLNTYSHLWPDANDRTARLRTSCSEPLRDLLRTDGTKWAGEQGF